MQQYLCFYVHIDCLKKSALVLCYTIVMKSSVYHRVSHAASTPEFKKIFILRTIGNFLIFFSVFMIAKTFSQPVMEEARYLVDQYAHKQYVVVSSVQEGQALEKMAIGSVDINQPKGKLAEALAGKTIEAMVPADANFDVLIPKIGANARIIANVDAANDKEYLAALQQGVAHAKGTAFPGEGGHIFLFAHSTDYIWNVGSYNAVFYLLYKLDVNDEIDVFYKGQRYTYHVVGKTIVDPSQVQYLTRKTDAEFLTLQTCWPPGTSLQRLLVFAKRVVE